MTICLPGYLYAPQYLLFEFSAFAPPPFFWPLCVFGIWTIINLATGRDTLWIHCLPCKSIIPVGGRNHHITAAAEYWAVVLLSTNMLSAGPLLCTGPVNLCFLHVNKTEWLELGSKYYRWIKKMEHTQNSCYTYWTIVFRTRLVNLYWIANTVSEFQTSS